MANLLELQLLLVLKILQKATLNHLQLRVKLFKVLQPVVQYQHIQVVAQTIKYTNLLLLEI